MNNKICKEDAYKNLDIVNSWINNIDLKASFILAFLGILLGNILNVNNIEILKKFISIPINTMSLIEILRTIEPTLSPYKSLFLLRNALTLAGAIFPVEASLEITFFVA